MNAWFSRLGEPVAPETREQILAYLHGLGLESMPIETVSGWDAARRVVTHPDWDRRWWDAEQLEKRRLFAKASSSRPQADLLRLLSQTMEAGDDPKGAAATAAEHQGCADTGLIGSAAGSASETLFLSALARLVDEPPTHPFSSKQALFATGRWPLGILNGRYYLF